MVVKLDELRSRRGATGTKATSSRPQAAATRARDETPRFEPFGPTTRQRQLLGAFVIMAGGLPVALIASSRFGRPPYLHTVLIAVGATGVIGWLVDGRRYLGAGSAALALGLAFTISANTTIDQYALIFGLLGLSLLLVAKVNPHALAGSGGLLVYVSWSALGLHQAGATPIPPGWVVVLVMLFWGGAFLRRTLADRARDLGVRPASATAASRV